jgi:hypothetical protein
LFYLSWGTTESEKRTLFERWKSESELPGYTWDVFLDLELSGQSDPKLLVPANILSVQVKNLLQYAIPLFEGNPHTASRVDKPGSVWLQYDSDLKVLDLSFKEYRVSTGEKIRVSGLYLWWRNWWSSSTKMHFAS